MHGGDLIAAFLKAQGVRFLFTLCGGHISPILVGCKQAGIRVVDVRHEATAVFAADAVARLTGVPGVAAGPAGSRPFAPWYGMAWTSVETPSTNRRSGHSSSRSVAAGPSGGWRRSRTDGTTTITMTESAFSGSSTVVTIMRLRTGSSSGPRDGSETGA